MGGVPRLLRVPAVVFAVAVAGVLLAGGPAMAGSVAVVDGAHVLSRSDMSTVRDAASRLGPDAVRIYTATGLANDPAAFDEHYARKLATADPATVIIGINTLSGHVTVHGGTGSHLHRKQSAAAVAAFTGGLRADQGYARALLAMLRSLQGALTGHEQADDGTRAAAAGPAGAAGDHAVAGQAGDGGGTGRTVGLIVVAAIVVAIAGIIVRAVFGGRRGPVRL